MPHGYYHCPNVAHGYPILLDLSERLVVVIGGGAVAGRKVAGVLAAGATRVRCVAPAFCEAVPAEIERVQERYESRHLDGAHLVFAATDRHEVNDAVVADARRMGILVNRADADEALPGDFSTPAQFEEGPVLITVSAGSAALSAALRDDIAHKIDHRFIAMATAMKTLRPEIRASALPPSQRAAVFRALASDEALNALEAGDLVSLRTWLNQRFPELQALS